MNRLDQENNASLKRIAIALERIANKYGESEYKHNLKPGQGPHPG